MFPYRVKYNESEYDIQNNDLSYKIDQQCQNTFDILKIYEKFGKMSTSSILYFIIYVNCIIQILQILYFWDLCVFLNFYIYTYITRVGLLHV